MVNGDNTQISDCAFEWNDWTGVGGSWPLGVPTLGKAHRGTTVWIDENSMYGLNTIPPVFSQLPGEPRLGDVVDLS